MANPLDGIVFRTDPRENFRGKCEVVVAHFLPTAAAVTPHLETLSIKSQ